MEPATAVMGMLAEVVRALHGNEPAAGNLLPGFRMTQPTARGVSTDALSDATAASNGPAGANAQGQAFALENPTSPSAADLRICACN